MGKKPRIRLDLLQRPKNLGGLALPNFRHYYWASNVQKIIYWLNTPDEDWCQIEAASCISTSLRALVTSSLPISSWQHTTSLIVNNTLKIWAQFRKNFGFENLLHLTPIHNNHLFLPARLDSEFALWQRRGLHNFSDMYIDGVLASFQDLSHKFDLPRSSLFRYFQVRHFLQNHNPDFPNIIPSTAVDDLLKLTFKPKGLISRINNCIASFKNITMPKIKADWENELGVDLEEEIWESALLRVNNSTFCAKLNIIQFKILHRIHYSKARLARIFPNIDASCESCRNPSADLTHMFWSCPTLKAYWSTIFNTLSEALNVELQPNAVMGIFGVTERGHRTLRKSHKNIIAFTTLLARRRILLHWKSKKPPKAALWFSDLTQFIQLEKIKYALKGSKERFFCCLGYIAKTFREN